MSKRKQTAAGFRDDDDSARATEKPALAGSSFGGHPHIERRSGTKRYQHKPLDPQSIRVLELLPGEFGAPLKANLNLFDFTEGLPEWTSRPDEFDHTQDHETSRVQDDESTGSDGQDGLSDQDALTFDYETLSYAWGPPVYDQSIEIDGEGTLNITSSLYSALQHLRYSERSRVLWADAVCINQLDNEEKGGQVSIMMYIYAHARSVIVWLGPGSSEDELAFATIEKVQDLNREIDSELERVDQIVSQSTSGLESQTRDEVWREYSDRLAEVADGLIAATTLFMRPWWSRLWVVQEVYPQLQTENRCVTIASGSLTTSWDRFEDAMFLLDAASDAQALRWPIGTSQLQSHFRRRYNDFADVFELATLQNVAMALDQVVHCTSLQCSVPLDRIYALYNLLRLQHIPSLQPDYTQAAGRLFHSFALAVLSYYKDGFKHPGNMFSLLAMAGTESPETIREPRPSWVPNFHRLTQSSRLRYKLHELRRTGAWDVVAQWGAERTIQAVPKVSTDALKINGRVFARVAEVLSFSNWPTSDSTSLTERDCCTQTLQWYMRCKSFIEGALQIDKPDLVDLFTTGGRLVSQDWDPDLAEIYESAMRNLAPAGEEPSDTELHLMMTIHKVIREQPDRDGVIEQIVKRVDPNRHLCVLINLSGNVDVGWVPVSAQRGDQLCVFHGCRYPFVLRSTGTEEHSLVGDAWTLRTTLKEALCDIHDCPDPTLCRLKTDPRPPCNRWDSQDQEMQDAIAKMEDITLV